MDEQHEGSHSVIAPSSAATWVKCPGFVAMEGSELALPDEEHEAAREGEASHYVAASRLLETTQIDVGSVAPNGVIITREMIDCAMVYAKDVWAIYEGIPHSTINVEKKIEALEIHPKSWGSVDAWLFDSRDIGRVYLWDYKYGYGIVEAIKNWQMVNYACGVVSSLKITDPNTRVTMTIAQPRPFHEDGAVRRWTITVGMLWAYRDQLKTAAEIALGPNPSIQSGPHCKYCRARHMCPAAHRAAMEAIDITRSATIASLDSIALGHELELLRRAEQAIKNRLTGVEAQAMAAIKKNGAIIPGFRIGPGQGKVDWRVTEKEVFELGKLVGVDLRKAPAAITPKQAINAGVDPALIEMYSVHKAGKVKLVADDGERAKQILGGK